ncbi:hypothetical protein [Thiomonas sp.]
MAAKRTPITPLQAQRIRGLVRALGPRDVAKLFGTTPRQVANWQTGTGYFSNASDPRRTLRLYQEHLDTIKATRYTRHNPEEAKRNLQILFSRYGKVWVDEAILNGNPTLAPGAMGKSPAVEEYLRDEAMLSGRQVNASARAVDNAIEDFKQRVMAAAKRMKRTKKNAQGEPVPWEKYARPLWSSQDRRGATSYESVLNKFLVPAMLEWMADPTPENRRAMLKWWFTLGLGKYAVDWFGY